MGGSGKKAGRGDAGQLLGSSLMSSSRSDSDECEVAVQRGVFRLSLLFSSKNVIK